MIYSVDVFSPDNLLHSPDMAQDYAHARNNLVASGVNIAFLDRQLVWWNFHQIFDRFPSLTQLSWEDESFDCQTATESCQQVAFYAHASLFEADAARQALSKEFKGWARCDPDLFYDLLEQPEVTRTSLMTSWLEWAFDGNLPAFVVEQNLDKDLPAAQSSSRPRM